MPFFDIPNGAQRGADDRTFLPDATADDWQTLLRSVGAEPFVEGQVLIEAGDPGDCFFILAEGLVQVQVRATFGVKAIATIGAGSVFGEIAFLDGGVRTATVRALSAGKVLRVSRAAFVGLQAWEPQLAQRIALDLGRLCALRLRRVLAKHGR
jgi:CRP-like cAMP-binding protein